MVNFPSERTFSVPILFENNPCTACILSYLIRGIAGNLNCLPPYIEFFFFSHFFHIRETWRFHAQATCNFAQITFARSLVYVYHRNPACVKSFFTACSIVALTKDARRGCPVCHNDSFPSHAVLHLHSQLCDEHGAGLLVGGVEGWGVLEGVGGVAAL